jgi:hypothetical protein
MNKCCETFAAFLVCEILYVFDPSTLFSGCQGLKKFVNFGDSEEPNSSKSLGLVLFGGYADEFGLDGFFVY